MIEELDLAKEFGGRPDMPPGVRSFRDGVPLVVWIFEKPGRFGQDRAGAYPPLRFARGYFDARTGWVITSDDDDSPEEKLAANYSLLGYVTHQLVHWFSRQRHRWRKPLGSGDFFYQGFSRWMGGAVVSADGTIDFARTNRFEIREMRRMAKLLEEEGQQYRLFPLKTLVSSSYYAAGSHASLLWDVDPEHGSNMFSQQSWAFIRFLNEQGEGRYRESFLRLFDRVLDGRDATARATSVAEAMRLRRNENWNRLEEAFFSYVASDLLEGDLGK